MELHLSQSSQQIKLMEELGCPLFMRLGKCVPLKEADNLSGTPMGSFVISKMLRWQSAKSTLRGTIRLGGWAYHPTPPASQPDLTPRRAGDHSRFLPRHSGHLLYRKLLGRLRGWARRAGPRSSEAFCFLVSRAQCRPHMLPTLPFRDSARVCFNYHLYSAVCLPKRVSACIRLPPPALH
jgi:hypothetical protein